MFGMNDAIDAAVLGAIVSFALVNLSEAIKRFHKMRSVAMAICAELGEIEKQFCWDLANQIVKAGERKLFINIKYSETYTTVFDSCVTCLDFFEVAEGAKIVALYMRIRDLFDALRTESYALELHIGYHGFSEREKFREMNEEPLLIKAEDLKNAILEVYPILEKYYTMSIVYYWFMIIKNLWSNVNVMFVKSGVTDVKIDKITNLGDIER